MYSENNQSVNMEGFQNPPPVVAAESVATTPPAMRAMPWNVPAGLIPNIVVAQMPVAVMEAKNPEKFIGQNFNTWQPKMHVYLTQLGFARYLTEDTPRVDEDEFDHQVLMEYTAWKDSEYLCRNYVLYSVNDVMYKVYCTKSSVKELWESLDRKYRTANASSKKYIVGRFLEFQMVDLKTVTSQVQDL
ncbi:hypothetical protein QQ045_020217 [Rhodiola kirilowii]